MRRNEISLSGRINRDGKLSLYKTELECFCREHPNTRIVATFRVYRPGSSAALRGYYYNYVVPTVRMALWETGDLKTEEQTEEWLRAISPSSIHQEVNNETGKYITSIRRIQDMDNSELMEHIEFIRQYAAENLNVFIEDPKTI